MDVCPVDCIHPRKDEPAFDASQMLYIHPDECIDCEACIPECPVHAIYYEGDVPPEWAGFIELMVSEEERGSVIDFFRT